MAAHNPLQSFFMAGFECSSHRRPDGVRLDLIAGTGHDRLAAEDYRNCTRLGLRSIRDGLRWHLIEREPGVYDWSSWIPMLQAAAEADVQVIWDLFHYGSPDHVDQGSADFVHSYVCFVTEAVRVHREVTGSAAFVCPINEISYLTWAVRTGYFPRVGPDERGWFKRHLVSAAIAGVRRMRDVEPDCRFLWAEPLIHVAPRGSESSSPSQAEEARLGQFEAYDMLVGRTAPELGGSPDMVDLMGLNFYPDNQWSYEGSTIPLGHHRYRPLADMLAEVYDRYRRPLVISETGSEGSSRPAWLHYVCDEAREAVGQGVPLKGICLYPVTAYPGWDDARHTATGLFTGPVEEGRRIYRPLAEELERQQALWRSGEEAKAESGFEAS